MTEMLALNWKQVDEIVTQIEEELNNADKEFENLNELVVKKLGHLEQLMNDPDQVVRDEAIAANEEIIASAYQDIVLSCPYQEDERSSEPEALVEPAQEPSKVEELNYLNEKDGPGLEDQQPQNSLLKRAHDNLERLKQTADKKFDLVLQSLKIAKNEANERMRFQEGKRQRVDANLSNIQTSLKFLLEDRRSQSGAQPSTPNYIPEPEIQIGYIEEPYTGFPISAGF